MFYRFDAANLTELSNLSLRHLDDLVDPDLIELPEGARLWEYPEAKDVFVWTDIPNLFLPSILGKFRVTMGMGNLETLYGVARTLPYDLTEEQASQFMSYQRLPASCLWIYWNGIILVHYRISLRSIATLSRG